MSNGVPVRARTARKEKKFAITLLFAPIGGRFSKIGAIFIPDILTTRKFKYKRLHSYQGLNLFRYLLR